MLRRLSLLSPTEGLERHPSLELALRAAWTDNANVLSTQYSGKRGCCVCVCVCVCVSFLLVLAFLQRFRHRGA
jgi:hypothetical protein